ncbi:IS3 family transposase, partial [Escherichia coli]
AFGVEPLCRVLQVSPSAYRRHAARLRDYSRRSVRAIRDEMLAVQIRRVWQENYEVYGARKVWRQMHRERQGVARCTVERLMREMGLCG